MATEAGKVNTDTII